LEESDLARSFPLPLPVVAVVVVAVVVVPVLVSPDFSPCLVERLVVLMPLVRLPPARFLVSVVVGPVMSDSSFIFMSSSEMNIGSC
jgi:hypothetical protein